jgi:hypothetical protein
MASAVHEQVHEGAEQQEQIGKRVQNMHLVLRVQSQQMGLMLRHQEKSRHQGENQEPEIEPEIFRGLGQVIMRHNFSSSLLGQQPKDP